MIRLQVWLRPPRGAPRTAGELLVADPDPRRGGRLRGEFRYSRPYLEWSGAFALDPLHLPLAGGVFEAGRPQAGIHGVFEDSLPDDWGRRILCRRYGLTPARSRPPALLALIGGHALGALAYSEREVWQAEDTPLPEVELEALMAAALRFEDSSPDQPLDELMRLFQAASSPGGARPKVLVGDGRVGWLVKLPSVRDRYDMVRLEAAALSLAEAAGMEVPRHRLPTLKGRAALMLQRFDETPAGGRNHLISMQSLLGAEGYYTAGYADLAGLIRRVSDRPESDLPALYRQMTFNAALGNTDDHLKNFAMLHGSDGWRLTPAFDLLPDVFERREHLLHFGTSGLVPGRDALREMAAAFGLSAHRADGIRDEVIGVLTDWRKVFAACEVPDGDRDRLAASIDGRLRRLA